MEGYLQIRSAKGGSCGQAAAGRGRESQPGEEKAGLHHSSHHEEKRPQVGGSRAQSLQAHTEDCQAQAATEHSLDWRDGTQDTFAKKPLTYTLIVCL